MTQKIYVVGHIGAGKLASITTKIHEQFGEDVEIIEAETIKDIRSGNQSIIPYGSSPILAERMYEPILTRTDDHKNTPWYNQFDKKHKKYR